MKIGKHYLVAYQNKADWVNFVETKLSTATHHRFNMRRMLLEVTTNERDLGFYLGQDVFDEHVENRLQGCQFHSVIFLEGVYRESTVNFLLSKIKMFVN